MQRVVRVLGIVAAIANLPLAVALIDVSPVALVAGIVSTALLLVLVLAMARGLDLLEQIGARLDRLEDQSNTNRG